jgi:hypothetical protein
MSRDTNVKVGERVTRFELIDTSGRAVVFYGQEPFEVRVLEQDDKRTVKVYVGANLGIGWSE